MKYTLLLFTTVLLLSIQSHAQQMVIGNGAHVVSGTHLVLNSDSLVNRGTMRIKPEGVVHLTGNLNNHGTMTHEKGSGVLLYGSAPQVIGGSNPVTFSTLNLNNSAGFTLAKDATVNGNLLFLNGMISTGANLLAIGDTGTITNAAAVRYVDGKLVRTFSGIGTKAFPIGKGGHYRPVTLQFSALTGTSQVTAEQFETGLTGTLPADVTLTTTNRYWSLTQSGGSNMQYLVTLDATGYTPERPVVILKKDAGVITSHEATTPDYTNATALTTFSDFGLGEECLNPTGGGTIEGGQTICAGESPTGLTGDIPTGFTGTLEYKWQVSTTSSTEGFTDIANTDSQDYTPVSVSQTSWFKRLARVYCKSGWTGAAESNVVEIVVELTPVSGTLAKTPDQTIVCEASNVSAALTPGSGGSSVDSTCFRTNGGAGWSSWTNYISGTNISTTGKTEVEVRTKRKGTVCSDASWNTVSWSIDPMTAGGSISGGVVYCTPVNNTLLTLAGHTGIVQKWQSADNLYNWSDIASVTTTTYTAVNVSSDTWYRVIVKSGLCPEKVSDSALIAIGNNVAISGYAKYDNNPKTPLNGIKVLLRKNNVLTDSTITSATGYYAFENLQSGNYSLHLKSAHPSGQWQTWSGVTNTDYMLVSKHIAGTQLLPVDPPVVRISASTKLPHPLINSDDAVAIRQAAKFPLTGYSYFDTVKWVFSGIDAAHALTGITLDCDNVTRDIMGLCTGDVNGTYVPPSGYKTAVETLHATSLQLQHRGNIPLADEMIFPIRVNRNMEIGAITLYLDFDPSVMIVTNVTTVTTVTNGPELWYNVSDPTLNLQPETLNLQPSTLNTLQIGWMSLDPVTVAEGQAVILIHARMRDDALANPIRFTLNENPLSEFADADGNVIGGLKLSMPTAGNSEMAKWRNSEIFVYPNPAQSTLNLELETFNPEPETLTLEMVNLQGVVVMTREPVTISAGWHKNQLDLRGIAPGVYFLRAKLGGDVTIKKIMITR